MITYVRWQTSLQSVEKRQDILKITEEMTDILILEVLPSIDKEPVYIINSYNTPMKSKLAGRPVDIMMKVPELLHKCMLIIRDFNLHHTDWDNRTVNPTAQAKRFVDWIANKNAIYELEIKTVTHARGGALDLVIANN